MWCLTQLRSSSQMIVINPPAIKDRGHVYPPLLVNGKCLSRRHTWLSLILISSIFASLNDTIVDLSPPPPIATPLPLVGNWTTVFSIQMIECRTWRRCWRTGKRNSSDTLVRPDVNSNRKCTSVSEPHRRRVLKHDLPFCYNKTMHRFFSFLFDFEKWEESAAAAATVFKDQKRSFIQNAIKRRERVHD